MIRARWISAALFALATCTAGCTPTVRGASSAPPSITARHDWNLFSDDEITLSQGAALALDCFDPVDGTCDEVRVTSADAHVARVYTAHLEQGPPYEGAAYRRPARPGFVVTGVSAGETALRFENGMGTTTVRVHVER
jgi:hypothetical protein